MVSNVSNPLAQGAIYAKGANMSMSNSYSVMEKTLVAMEEQAPESSNSIQYQIDLNSVTATPKDATLGGMIDFYA